MVQRTDCTRLPEHPWPPSRQLRCPYPHALRAAPTGWEGKGPVGVVCAGKSNLGSSLGKNWKAGTRSRREGLHGPSNQLGCTVTGSLWIQEPPEALSLHWGLWGIPGGPTRRWQSEGGHLQKQGGCQADAASVFSSSFILVSVWVAHVSSKVMGKCCARTDRPFKHLNLSWRFWCICRAHVCP